MIGKIVTHYKIMEKLGEGGMGVVYKAEDIKLKRTVALKFLPPALSSNQEAKERFIQEAQAASALEHPNICTIYEIDETDDGQLFIVMACYDGESLKKKIEREPIDLESIVDIATQIAAGLARAHEAGIIHRDIKPANIMVTERGEVKILDFGLAKLAGRAQLTKTGSTVGTVAYMSPEQAQGQEVDHRTDIWSLAVVIYEMLTGQLPFKGEYEQAIMYSIINEEPEPLSKYLPGLSTDLKTIINRCLQKNPLDRHQQMNELITDLKSLKAQSHLDAVQLRKEKRRQRRPIFITAILSLFIIATIVGYFIFSSEKTSEKPELKSIAVLPFSNLRSDPETDFLGFALADQIIGNLAYLKNISVRPSSSVRKYKIQMIDAKTAGTDLKVDYILAGNYLREANDVRLNVELVNVHTNEIVWREPIEVQYENTFKLQDIVSERVIDGLKIQFSPDERYRMEIDVPHNSRAYEYFLRGIAQPATIDGIRRAIDLLQHSIQIDSSYAPAFNELGFRIHRLTSYKLYDVDRIWEAGRAYQRALSLNAELLGALGNLSILFIENGRLEEAEKLAEQMLRINPNNALVHFVFGYIYRYAGLMEEAKKEMEKAVMLDPNDVRFRSLGITYCYLEEYDKAFEAFEIDKGSLYALTFQGWTFLRQGKIEIAGNYFDRAIAMEPDAQLGLWSSALKAFVEGSNEEGLSILRRLEQANPPDADNWYLMGVSYALLGDEDSCIRVSMKAVERGFYNYPLLAADKFFDTVRYDPEFQQVLALAKEKHETFRKKFFPEKE